MEQEPKADQPVKKKKEVTKSAAKEISYIALAVALLAVCAWISLPIGEVAFTLQTFAVCFIGGLLGIRRGTAAVAIYIFMGLIGIPVYAGFKAGTAVLFGTTGGYLIGFLFTAPITGLAKFIPVRKLWAKIFLLYLFMIVGLAVCYFFGTVWFITMFARLNDRSISVYAALSACVFPFILPDLIKLAIAAALCVRLEKVLFR